MIQCSLNKDLKNSFDSYLLKELPPSEIAAIEKHLSTGCSICVQEIKELEETLASIACIAPLATPSDVVRQKLLARLNTESRTQAPLKLVPAPKKPWYQTTLNLLGKVAASLGVLILLAETVFLVHVNKQARLHAQLQEHKIQALQAELKQKQNAISSIETSIESSRKLIVLDSKLISKASGKALWDTEQNAWMFYISNLPAAPKGRTYQLWFITDEQQVISGGTFQTDINGSVQLPLATPRKCKNIREAAISLEPDGGSETPTGAIYLSGPV